MNKFIVIGLVFAAVACGSKGTQETSGPTTGNTSSGNGDPNSTPGPDGGSTDDPTTEDAGTKAPPTQAQCIATCETQFPKAAAESHSLDATCMLAGSCEKVCNDLVPGKNYGPTDDPNSDAGPSCDTTKANSDPISTPSAACSTCLANTPACCSIWISIFGSTDGRALNACSTACYSK